MSSWGRRHSDNRSYPKGSTARATSGHGSSMSEVHRRRGQDRLPSSGIHNEGALSRHGYRLGDSDDTRRHESLNKAVKQDGYKETVDRLAALEGLHHGQSGEGAVLHARAKADIEYLERQHGT